MRCLPFVLVTCALGRAIAAPSADVVVVWAPGADVAPVAAAGRALGAAVIDRSPRPAAAPALAPIVRRGMAAFDRLQLDVAWDELEAARAAADRTGAAGLTTAQLSDLFLYRGLVRDQRGDAAGAWEELIAAATVDPARVLDPARFPPKVIELIGRAREAVAAQPRASLAIDAPAGCTVTVDGAAFDPAAPQLVGAHWARVACRDRDGWGARITVTAPATRIAPPLPAPAPPSDAEVLIQARTAGARAVIVAAVRGGVATARLIGIDGRERARRSVAITGDLAPLGAAVRALGEPSAPPVRHRWYQSRWAWAAGAAVLAAAIFVPITAAVSGGNAPGTATLSTQGPP